MTVFNIKYKNSTTWHDLADYAFDIEPIPVKTRERDFTLNSRSFDFKIPFDYPFPDGENIDTIEKVRFTNGYFDGFEGTIKKTQEEWDSNYYQVTVFNDVENLREHFVTELNTANLYSANVDEYKYPDYYSREVAGFLYVLKKMAEISGANIGFDNIEGEICLKSKEFIYTDYSRKTETNILFRELKIDVRMLRSIGQFVARTEPANEFEQDNSQWDEKNAATFYDVYNYFASMFGLELRYSTIYNEYRFFLVEVNEFYNLSDDDKFNYKPKKIEATGRVKFQLQGAKRTSTADSIQAKYYQNVDTDLTSDFWYEKQAENSNIPTNLFLTCTMREFNNNATYKGSMWPVLYDVSIKTSSHRNYMNPDDEIKAGGIKFGDHYRFDYENNYEVEEFISDYVIADDTTPVKAVIQQTFDIENLDCRIIQRKNT